MYLSSSLSSLLLPAPPSPSSSSDRGGSPSPSPAALSAPSAPFASSAPSAPSAAASLAPPVSSGADPVGDAGAAGALSKGALSVPGAWSARPSVSIVPSSARCRSVRSVVQSGLRRRRPAGVCSGAARPSETF